MGKFPGHLDVHEVIELGDGSEVTVAYGTGGQYLVLSVTDRCGECWVCAPASDTAVDCVRQGRTSPWAVVHHSATGTVDLYRAGLDGRLQESVVLCSRLPLGLGVLAAA